MPKQCVMWRELGLNHCQMLLPNWLLQQYFPGHVRAPCHVLFSCTVAIWFMFSIAIVFMYLIKLEKNIILIIWVNHTVYTILCILYLKYLCVNFCVFSLPIQMTFMLCNKNLLLIFALFTSFGSLYEKESSVTNWED